MRSRRRSHPAVEPATTPSSAPVAPRASTAARVASHWPSMRSPSSRSSTARSTRAVSVRLSRSWVARWSTAAASGPSSAGLLTECVFESMAATYQPRTRTQGPTRNCGQRSPAEAGPSERARRVEGNPRARQLHGARPTAPPTRTAPWPRTPTHRATHPHGARHPRPPSHVTHGTRPPNPRDPTAPAYRGRPSDPHNRLPDRLPRCPGGGASGARAGRTRRWRPRPGRRGGPSGGR
jgi:hypothetical protein